MTACLFLLILVIAWPVCAQCITICYATNANVKITMWSGYWDFMMGYWTYSWTETYTWDCDPLYACTSSCAVCERSTEDKSTDGINYTPVGTLTGFGTSATCTNGNTDIYYGSANLFANTYYRFRWMVKPKLPDNTCDGGVWTLGDTRTFQTGPPG